MHILKFTASEIDPLNVVCYETIGFSETFRISELGLEILYETIGFSEIFYYGDTIELEDTIGFFESYPILFYDIELEETIGFNDGGDESLVVYCYETIGFNDIISQDLSMDVMCIETVGFNIGGYNEIYTEHDITFTWRVRTNSHPSYGYGASEYGNIVSYGDGDASNLVSFEIHIWKVGGPESNRYLNSNPVGEYSERLVKEVINITDTTNPDLDATYTLTASDNILYAGEFTPDLEAEIFVKDDNGVYSFPKIILTRPLKVNHED